ERPEALGRGEVVCPDRGRVGLTVARVGGPVLDPRREIREDVFGQLLLGRHLRAVVADGFQQDARGRVTRGGGGGAAAALEQAGAAIEEQVPPGLRGLGRVARVTVLN